MNVVANTWVDIVRGTEVDEFADEVDLDPDDPAATRICWNKPAALTEIKQNPYSRAAGMDRVVRYATLRISARLEITRGCTVRDRKTGYIWIVDTPANIHNPAITPDTRVDLRRTI
jgi:hypothetical protein